jgi:hypothetical protein
MLSNTLMRPRVQPRSIVAPNLLIRYGRRPASYALDVIQELG